MFTGGTLASKACPQGAPNVPPSDFCPLRLRVREWSFEPTQTVVCAYANGYLSVRKRHSPVGKLPLTRYLSTGYPPVYTHKDDARNLLSHLAPSGYEEQKSSKI